jgi:hypothetical protein
MEGEMSNEARVGSARIVRVDAHNVAVEVYSEITSKKTGETRTEWKEAGYYGHRLDYAAQSALYESMPYGEPITPEMISNAVAEIVANTKAALEVPA